jgi:acetyl esterase/lipase
MDPDGPLHLAREIPVPRSVSAEAQATMAAGCAGVAARLESPPELPDPSDLEGWRARIAVMDELMVFAFQGRVDENALDVVELDVGGVRVYEITPRDAPSGDGAPVLLDIHGGALVGGGGEACQLMSSISAQRTGLRTWSVDYRMPPDHPYPAPLDDCVTVYRALLERADAARIVVSGASAGGNLAAATMLRARDEGLPVPAGLVLLSPEIDLTESGDTFATNVGVDYVLLDGLGASIALYAGDHDLTDPLLSPLFGDVTGFPPTFLQSGTRDLFLSNTVRMHRHLRDAGVDAELHVWEAMPHGGFFGAPEDAEIAAELRRFVARVTRGVG